MDLDLRENVPLAPLTNLGVGGNARFLLRAESTQEVAEAVRFAVSKKLPLFVLGGGSNLVISDRGWDGLVVQIAIPGIEKESDATFHVGAGVSWDDFVAHCVELNCAGVECLSGIPGSAGGTPVQNVGAYGQEVSDTIVSVLAFDLPTNSVRELTAAECGFGYRTSIFNSNRRNQFIVLRVSYKLVPGGEPALKYADLQKYFAEQTAAPSLADVRHAVREIRATKGMLITPGDPDSRSAGSFFKNPVLSALQLEALAHRAAERNLQIPSYPALQQRHKVSAAWLVEQSGFHKGYKEGAAGISTRHTLAIVNLGGATATEIVALKDEVQQRVQHTWGIELETEPVFVGW